MKISELPDCPDWLKIASTIDADVVWHGNKEFVEWRGGEWRSGEWRSGLWRGGVWQGGEWRGGEWQGGEWRSGVWQGGEWRGKEDRINYMLSMLGIIGETGIAYRTTRSDGKGRHKQEFLQPEGEYYEDDLPAAGSGTCVKGIHVTTAARAWTYFGIDSTCQFWRVRFKRTDVLDCDGEKIRIRGGFFEKIERPF